ncbi:MAG: S46 family peptidase [Bacteroidota bacterium]
MRTRVIVLLFVIVFQALPSIADEGMWLPWQLSESQIEKIQEAGLNISSDELFSTEKTSLKDAIVSIDDGSCTGSFISKKGLLLTNHHCAMGEIQQHSTVDDDFIRDGFWATSLPQELPNPGKTATLLTDVRNVTPHFEKELEKADGRLETEEAIDSIKTSILDTLTVPKHHEAEIKDFYHKNKFYILTTRTFHDVRLVGAPPRDVGQFGADKDNWMWPRHSADFALFRVYTSPDGTPAEYHPENIPYEPEKTLNINAKGIEEGDFTMVMGYPGESQRFLTSHGIKETKEIINPVVADVRGIRQKIWKKHMEKSPVAGIQYAEKYATSSNYHKYAIGQNSSIENNNLTSKRKKHETQFTENIQDHSGKKPEKILNSAKLIYLMRRNLTKTTILTLESLINGPDINSLILDAYPLFHALQNEEEEKINSNIEQLSQKGETFFRDFSQEIDKQVFDALLKYYRSNLPDSMQIDRSVLLGEAKSFEELSRNIYTNSVFANQNQFQDFIQHPSTDDFINDPGFAFFKRVMEEFSPVYSMFNRFEDQLDHTMHQYTNALMDRYSQHNFYPNANSTLRITTGKVANYSPDDGIAYSAFSTHKGIIEKINSGKDAYQPEYPLKELLNNDFSEYSDGDDNLPVCFITDNDITGGNSGSPVLNGNGEIIGLAFDGNWEGMASDISYNADKQRCVSADIRYILFVMNNIPKARHLLPELNIQQ